MNKALLELKLKELSNEYEATNDASLINIIQKTFETYLKNHPQDSETCIRYAIFLKEEPTISYPEKSVEILEQLLDENPQDIRALIVLADIKDSSCGGIDDKLLKHLNSIHVENHELMSMIEYIKSTYYRLKDPKQYEECLTKSVNLYQAHVNNNKELGEIYLSQGKMTEACKLLRQALTNISYIYPEVWPYLGKTYHITTVDNFIDYFIKGTYNTQSNLKDLGELYLKSCPVQ